MEELRHRLVDFDKSLRDQEVTIKEVIESGSSRG